ncbi:MAG TPA: YiiX family permuted papain-like enzyme [Bacteroidia bacterium]|nr:YiiX family permuted papain-like enzyme [Bacteroidia bacterium]
MKRLKYFILPVLAIGVALWFANQFALAGPDAITDGDKKKNEEVFHDGDMIFQTSQSGQSLAVSYATHSKYTHCGLLFSDNGKWYVYEAVQPVKKTLFKDWIAMGDSNYYVVRRLIKSDSIMTPAVVTQMRASCNKRMGKNYDLYFGWNDSLIYCSELVWKAYNESTGLEVGHPKPMKEYDLTHPLVLKTMTQRYGTKIPYEELMISPGDIFDSELLTTVKEGIK